MGNKSSLKNEKEIERNFEMIYLQNLFILKRKIHGIFRFEHKQKTNFHVKLEFYQNREIKFNNNFLKKYSIKKKKLITEHIISLDNIFNFKNHYFFFFVIDLDKDLNIYAKYPFDQKIFTLKTNDYFFEIKINNIFNKKEKFHFKKNKNDLKILIKKIVKKKNFLIELKIKRKIFLNGDVLNLLINFDNSKNKRKLKLSFKFVQFWKYINKKNKIYKKKIIILKENLGIVSSFLSEEFLEKLNLKKLPISFVSKNFKIYYKLIFYVKSSFYSIDKTIFQFDFDIAVFH